MAFVIGKRVFHGGSGEFLSSHKNHKAAVQQMRRLHREHDPLQKNRGARARLRLKGAKGGRK